MYKIVCPVCKGLFMSATLKRFCSNACKTNGTKYEKKNIAKCIQCDSYFVQERNTARYCSTKCLYIARNGVDSPKYTKKCKSCDNEFTTNRKDRVFCCEECRRRYIYFTNKEVVREKRKKYYYANADKAKESSRQWRIKNREKFLKSQSASHDYIRFDGNREAVLNRDNYQCVKCGSKERLNVHHKDFSGQTDTPNHQLDNLETLCDTCHIDVHKIRGDRSVVTTICQYCGTSFEAWACKLREGRNKYCSEACKLAKMSQPKASFTVNCLVCGKEFQTTEHKQSLGKGKYCGRECYQKAQIGTHKNKPKTKQIPTTCLTCGKEFMTTQYYLDNGRDKYCSKKCSNIGMRMKPKRENIPHPSRVYVNCKICGKEFHVVKSEIEKGRGKYCSRECYNIARNKPSA